MKGIKKLLTGVLAATMIMSASITAFANEKAPALTEQAAGDGSITVSNTTKAVEYSLYKVFDATYSGDNVAYTYDGHNSTFLAALNSATSPFKAVSNGSSYNIVRKADVQDGAIIEFIKANGPVQGNDGKWTGGNYGAAVATLTGNGESITFSNVDYGYYFITSTLGTLVTIDSALKDVEVIDKNQGSTLDKKEKVANGTWVYEGEFDETAKVPTAKVGDKVEYMLDGTLTQYIKDEKVDKFTFTDTMSSGLTLSTDDNGKTDVVVKLNGANVTASVSQEVSVDASGETTLKIVVPATLLTKSTMSYVITYSAVINENAVVKTTQQNEVDLKYNDGKDVDYDKTKVINYEITLTKTDAQ